MTALEPHFRNIQLMKLMLLLAIDYRDTHCPGDIHDRDWTGGIVALHDRRGQRTQLKNPAHATKSRPIGTSKILGHTGLDPLFACRIILAHYIGY
jgi:hypothetical protein